MPAPDLQLYRHLRLNAEPGILPDFGEILRSRREDLNLTQARVAALAGCAPSTISMLECGPRTFLPRRALFWGLGRALNLSAADMLEAAGYLEPLVEVPMRRAS